MCVPHAKLGTVEGGKLRTEQCWDRGQPAAALRWGASMSCLSPRFPGSPAPSNEGVAGPVPPWAVCGQGKILEVASSLSADVFQPHSLHSACTVRQGLYFPLSILGVNREGPVVPVLQKGKLRHCVSSAPESGLLGPWGVRRGLPGSEG